MQIKTLVVTPFQQNCRILFSSTSRAAAIIDPGGEVDRIISELNALNLKPESILLTHAHIDHGAGVAALEERLHEAGFSPKLYAHPNEKDMRASIETQAQMFGLPSGEYRNVREPDVYLDDGGTFKVGEYDSRALFTPGHAPGHISLFFESAGDVPVLIAGDTLFASSIGRTDLPGGDFDTLVRSIREKLYVLPDETIVLSGHGPDTTIGQEKRHNPFVRAQ